MKAKEMVLKGLKIKNFSMSFLFKAFQTAKNIQVRRALSE